MLPIYRALVLHLIEHESPDAVLTFRVSDADQQRADDLTDRNKQGHLTADEARELAEMIEFDEFVTLLKAQALHRQRTPQRT